MPLIPKWMVLPSTEDPSWACPSDMPYGNVLVEAYFPIGKEDRSHVVIPRLYHLDHLQKLINIGWRVSVIEPNITSYEVKPVFRHELPEEIGAWIFLLIKGGDTPEIFPLPSRAGGH